MEIKIVITKQNKEHILKLIDRLVECEAEGIAAESTSKMVLGLPSTSACGEPIFSRNLPTEKIKVAELEVEKRSFGSWGMFNSFLPGKAALRVLINLIGNNDGKPVMFSSLTDACMTYFSSARLYKYRGFPKKTSESSRARLAMHLIRPYYEMGLMRVYGNGKDQQIMITKEGLDFAQLRNPLLDEDDKAKYLSEEEARWMISHLKKVDKMGYKEFSILRELTCFLAGGEEKKFEDIVNWFKDNQAFVDWLRNGSRYENDPEAFSHQLQNVARTFASGKIALLRELGMMSSSRATYQILRSLEAC